jgi:hypothetical protein
MQKRFTFAVALIVIGLALASVSEQTDSLRTLSVPVAQPAPVEPCTNVTQAEYERALAKWRAREVLEYELTVDSPAMGVGGRFRLHVLVENGHAMLVGITDQNPDEPVTLDLDTLSLDDLNFYRERTVEEMLRQIGKLFTGELLDPTSLYEECYNVEFEPTLGYPSLVRSGLSQRRGGPPVRDCCINYEVLNLRILRSGLPGMPKSGNPDT